MEGTQRGAGDVYVCGEAIEGLGSGRCVCVGSDIRTSSRAQR